jgi:hypothetical protein
MKGLILAGWVYIPKLIPSFSLLYLLLSNLTRISHNNLNMSDRVSNPQTPSVEPASGTASDGKGTALAATPSHSKVQFTKQDNGFLSCTYEGKMINPCVHLQALPEIQEYRLSLREGVQVVL